MKMLVAVLCLLTVSLADAAVKIVAPRDGACVPTLSDGQRAYLALPRSKRLEIFADPVYRDEMCKLTGCPRSLTVVWQGGCGPYGVVVRKVSDGTTVFRCSTDVGTVVVENLEIACRYEIEVRDADKGIATACFQTEDVAPRLLRVPDVPNARDLGGWKTADGLRVRQGRVFRMAGLNDNADAKWMLPGKSNVSGKTRSVLLEDFGVRSDVDLRRGDECLLMNGSPLGPTVRWFHIASQCYGGMNTPDGRKAFSDVFRVFLDEGNYPVLFHCIGGKDRTGSIAFVLEALLGVEEEDLCRDWEATGFWLAERDFIHRTRFDHLVRAFDSYPGVRVQDRVEAYVKKCGFSDADIAFFRGQMLEGHEVCPRVGDGCPAGEALDGIFITGDGTGMNWIRKADSKEMPWIGPEFKWGTGTLKVDGVSLAWIRSSQADERCAVYALTSGVELVRTRWKVPGGFAERYEFCNRSDKAVKLSEIDIHTPFHDDYMPVSEYLLRRCQSHIWAGGSTAWVCSLRMGGTGPHLGLALTEGAITGYSEKERAYLKGNSDTRGILALSPPDTTLLPHASMSVAWRLFAHSGKRDFIRHVRKFGGVTATADTWTVTRSENVIVRFTAESPFVLDGAEIRGEGIAVKKSFEGGSLVAECSYEKDCEARVVCRLRDGRETWAEILARGDPKSLMAARAKFIVERQQYHGKSPDDPRDGAFVEYDNETERQGCRWELPPEKRPAVDHNEGAERLGMGVFLAKMAARGHRELLPPLERYARFVRQGLQDPDYTTWGEVDRNSRKRHFNYPWVAWFQAEMYVATGEKRHILDAYGTMMKLFTLIGNQVVCGTPEYRTVVLLRQAGFREEADKLLVAIRAHKDRLIDEGQLQQEVGFSPEYPGSMIPQLIGLWKLTGVEKYKAVALRVYLPMLEACMGFQPSWHMHDIGLHHWDDRFFGKRAMFGDTLPHYWNGTGAASFAFLAEALGDETFSRRAKAIVNQLLGLFDADGRAGCTWVLPNRVNGVPARFRDPLANDQDWALVYYLLATKEGNLL